MDSATAACEASVSLASSPVVCKASGDEHVCSETMLVASTFEDLIVNSVATERIDERLLLAAEIRARSGGTFWPFFVFESATAASGVAGSGDVDDDSATASMTEMKQKGGSGLLEQTIGSGYNITPPKYAENHRHAGNNRGESGGSFS